MQIDFMTDAYLQYSLDASEPDFPKYFAPPSNEAIPPDAGSIILFVCDVFCK